MIHLMLDDLGGEAGEGLHVLLEILVLIPDGDDAVPGGLPHTGQGHAAFLRLVGAFLIDGHGVEHYLVLPGLRMDDNDVLMDSDHVGGHAHAFVS